MIIDTHCHLDDSRYDEDLEEVLKRATDDGISHTLIPGADPKYLEKAMKLSQKYDNIYFAAGVHPYNIDNFDLAYLKKFTSHPKCIAIGECGLDYFRLPDDEAEKELVKQKQKDIFIQQIQLSCEVQKPLIVHIRDASFDSKEILLNHIDKDLGGVLHCYNASPILLELSQYNFYFGIGGVITFKNAKKLVDIVKDIPTNKLLLETDGPYLTPHPNRGKRNEPKFTRLILEKLSEILNIDSSILEKQILQNTKKLFPQMV